MVKRLFVSVTHFLRRITNPISTLRLKPKGQPQSDSAARKIFTPVTRIVRLLILPVLILALIFFTVISVQAFNTPTATIKKPEQILYQSIDFDYKVFPAESILYPSGTTALPPGKENFYDSLTKRIEFQAIGRIATLDDLVATEGSFDVEMILLSEDQWSKELKFKPEISFNQTDLGTLEFRTAFELPLEEARNLGAAILEEVQVRPKSDLILVIKSTLHTLYSQQGNLSMEESILLGEYQFSIDGPLIKPSGDLVFDNVVYAANISNNPNYMNIIGFPVTVMAVRILGPVLFIFFGLITGRRFHRIKVSRLSIMDKRELERKKVRKRFGNRVVKAGMLKVADTSSRVAINEYNELAKIADELEKPIIEVIPAANSDQETAGYYLVDGETLYFYKINITQQM